MRSSSSSPGLRSRTRSGSQSPASNFLLSGGRSYGSCGSAPSSVIRPAKPFNRNCSHAAQPGQRRPHHDDVVHQRSLAGLTEWSVTIDGGLPSLAAIVTDHFVVTPASGYSDMV